MNYSITGIKYTQKKIGPGFYPEAVRQKTKMVFYTTFILLAFIELRNPFIYLARVPFIIDRAVLCKTEESELMGWSRDPFFLLAILLGKHLATLGNVHDTLFNSAVIKEVLDRHEILVPEIALAGHRVFYRRIQAASIDIDLALGVVLHGADKLIA